MISKQRLAVFIPGLYEGGAERIMLNLAAGFADRGLSVDLVLAQAEGPYLDQIPDTVRIVELNRRPIRMWRACRSLPAMIAYLRRERPDYLLSALNANFVALEARRITGIPRRVVISQHNTFSHHYRNLPVWYRQLILLLVRNFYPRADEIVAVSKGVAEDLACTARIPRTRIRVIYNPVVTRDLALRTREPLQHPWFAPGSPPVILAVGRLTAEKDFGMLIRAFARIAGDQSARLIILGEGEERPRLEELLKDLHLEHKVMLPGFVSNPYPYMARSALLVCSSRSEGLPTVLIEALYCGIPIVSTDCPSGPREILQKHEYGQLVPVGDEATLARAMRDALSGKASLPPPESWQPYASEKVIDQYQSALLGTTQFQTPR